MTALRSLSRLLGFVVGGWFVYRQVRNGASAPSRERREDMQRDQTLEDTFPASDPPSIGGVS